MISIQDILDARSRIADSICLTPCLESIALSELTGSRVFVKFDNKQRTGSFKERGARNALLLLTSEQKQRGVIAASAGNHALGMAYHGGLLGIPVTVIMPIAAPLIKISTCESMGAKVILHGHSFDEARDHALEIAARENLRYINGFNDPEIIAGQGTIGLELLSQVPEMEAIIVPIGGGGLVAGTSTAIHASRPEVAIYGVQSAHAPGYNASLSSPVPVAVETKPTLADGLCVSVMGDLAFSIARQHVRKTVEVTEDEIALAILRAVEKEKEVVEGAGAAGLAALLAGKLPELRGKTVVLLFCGGNIDPLVLGRVIDKGLAADGRLARFRTKVTDRPGGLADLSRLIADQGANIIEIYHDRTFSGPDVFAVRVVCTVETRGASHLARLRAALEAAGYPMVL